MVSADCHPEACAIQDCLTKNQFVEGKCQEQVFALYQCCTAMYERAAKDGRSAEKAKSDSCPLPGVLARRMEAMVKEREGEEGKAGKA